MRLCDLNFNTFLTSITSPEVSSSQNNKRVQIQYGRPCLHFVSSSFNYVNLWQWLAIPCTNQLKSVNFFASFNISIINAYIWTFVSKWLFTIWTVRASQHSVWPDVIGDGCGWLPLWALTVHRTSHTRLMDFLINSWNIAMSMWITRISVTIFYLCLSYWPVLLKILGPYN